MNLCCRSLNSAGLKKLLLIKLGIGCFTSRCHRHCSIEFAVTIQHSRNIMCNQFKVFFTHFALLVNYNNNIIANGSFMSNLYICCFFATILNNFCLYSCKKCILAVSSTLLKSNLAQQVLFTVLKSNPGCCIPATVMANNPGT